LVVNTAGGTVVGEDHWVDVGGRTLTALEQFLSERVGGRIRVHELELLDSVESLRRITFADLS